MKTILSTFVILFGVCVCTGPTHATPSARVWNTKQSAKLQTLVARYVSTHPNRHRPLAHSISIAIGTNRGLLTEVAFGNAAPGQPATPETVYQIGSLTKPFTAFAMLKLLQKGANTRGGKPLSLNTPLNEIFLDVDHWKNLEGKAITLRNLLTMTSTLPNLTSRPPHALNPWGATPAKHILHALKESYPRPVSSTFEYSNTSYFLLAEVIDVILGGDLSEPLTYRDLLRTELFEKAGLTHTSFLGRPTPTSQNRAKPHYSAKPAFVQPDWLKGSADMLSTASDIYRMNRAMMSGKLLSKTFTNLMFSELNRVTPYDWYGMGWFVRDKGKTIIYSHSGSVPGFTAYNQVTCDKKDRSWLAITVLTNDTGVEGLDVLTSDIERIIQDN